MTPADLARLSRTRFAAGDVAGALDADTALRRAVRCDATAYATLTAEAREACAVECGRWGRDSGGGR